MGLNEESLKFLKKMLSYKKIHQATDFNILDCREFWRSENVVDWFKEKGYITYRQSSPGDFCDGPHLSFEDYCECDYPFAYHQADNGLAARDTTVRRWSSIEFWYIKNVCRAKSSSPRTSMLDTSPLS